MSDKNVAELLNKLNNAWHEKVSRKDFFRKCLNAGVCLGASLWFVEAFAKYKAYADIGEKRGMKEALYYDKIADDTVKCKLCPVGCVLSTGQRGFCRVREPVAGKLYTLVYELVTAAHVDPIEKKPMFHVLPGSKAFSIATAGCNSRCKCCQNWTISQVPPEETTNEVMTVRDVVQNAKNYGCRSVAYTYTDPAIFYEYMIATAQEARKNGILNIMHTGGKINPEPMKEAAKYVECANIDLKGFDKNFMNDFCAQDLDNILGTLQIARAGGMWVEITNLIIPTMNDNMGDIRRMVKWIRENMGADTPLHFSRFWPQYKIRTLYPTPEETLVAARNIAMEEGMNYVYIGNVPGSGGEDTTCPKCKKAVIKREGYTVLENDLDNKGTCKFCGNKIAGIWA